MRIQCSIPTTNSQSTSVHMPQTDSTGHLEPVGCRLLMLCMYVCDCELQAWFTDWPGALRGVINGALLSLQAADCIFPLARFYRSSQCYQSMTRKDCWVRTNDLTSSELSARQEDTCMEICWSASTFTLVSQKLAIEFETYCQFKRTLMQDNCSVPPGFYYCRNEHKIEQTPQYSEEIAIFQKLLQIWAKRRHVIHETKKSHLTTNLAAKYRAEQFHTVAISPIPHKKTLQIASQIFCKSLSKSKHFWSQQWQKKKKLSEILFGLI